MLQALSDFQEQPQVMELFRISFEMVSMSIISLAAVRSALLRVIIECSAVDSLEFLQPFGLALQDTDNTV